MTSLSDPARAPTPQDQAPPPGDSPPQTQTLTLAPSESCLGHDPDLTLVTFEDANLRDVVDGNRVFGSLLLTCRNVSELTQLDASNSSIASLVGIQNLTGLTDLDLEDNSISDISPLGGLTGLTDIGLRNNSISDISTLFGLPELSWVSLGGTDVSREDLVRLSATGVAVFTGGCGC